MRVTRSLRAPLHTVTVVVGTALLLAACTHSASPDEPTTSPTVPPTTAASPSAPVTSVPPGTVPPATGSPSVTPTTTPLPIATSTLPAIPGAQALISSSGPSDDGTGFQLTGVVTGIVEDGGTCTFTLSGTLGSAQHSQHGLADATSTACGTVTFPLAEAPSGTWTAVLTYSSAAGAVSSAPVEVTVP